MVLYFETDVDCSDAIEQIFICDTFETSVPDHFGKQFLVWEFTDGLHEVLIRFPIASKDLAHHRNHLKRVQVVHPEIREKDLAMQINGLGSKISEE